MFDSIFGFLMLATHVIIGGIFFTVLLIMILILLISLTASAIQGTIIVADTLRSKIKVRRTNGNRIRIMNNRQMAEYFLQNYSKIGQYKGTFGAVDELEKWLNAMGE